MNNPPEPEVYAKCNIGKGIFSDEYYMEIFDSENRRIWGFVDKSNIKIKTEPADNLVVGLVRVLQTIEEKDGRCLVELPTYDIDRVHINRESIEIFI